jgi:hypothetical protein
MSDITAEQFANTERLILEVQNLLHRLAAMAAEQESVLRYCEHHCARPAFASVRLDKLGRVRGWG